MFLWLTSPAPAGYGPGSGPHVFDSPVFYDVSPLNRAKQRNLTVNSEKHVKDVSISITQRGSRGDIVVFDERGKMHTFVRVRRNESENPFVRDRDGKIVGIARTLVAPDGGPVFLDEVGNPINFKRNPNGTPLLLDTSGSVIQFALPYRSVKIRGQPFFLDRSGRLIETVRGADKQAVLMAQGRKLVYYTIAVNDVFAFFLTGTKKKAITADHFPINAPELKAVEDFAKRKFPARKVLAVQVKFAWIEAAGLANNDDYVKTRANIPTFKMSDTHWIRVPNETRNALLALVGVNISFGVKHHKEMIWASFEHVNNTPNSTYLYRDGRNEPKEHPERPDGTWLFSSRGVGSPDENVRQMYLEGDNIRAEYNKTIGPSNILRLHPWGSRPNNADLNTDLISINRSVLGGLDVGDVRKNYIMTGATWTSSGDGGGTVAGADILANTTMETFFQTEGCLTCHRGRSGRQRSDSSMLGTVNGGVSHIYRLTNPLRFPSGE